MEIQFYRICWILTFSYKKLVIVVALLATVNINQPCAVLSCC